MTLINSTGISLNEVKLNHNSKLQYLKSLEKIDCSISKNHKFYKENNLDIMGVCIMLEMNSPPEREMDRIINNADKLFTRNDFGNLGFRKKEQIKLRCILDGCCNKYFISSLLYDKSSGWFVWHYITQEILNKLTNIHTDKFKKPSSTNSSISPRIRLYIKHTFEVVAVPHNLWKVSITASTLISKLNDIKLIKNNQYSPLIKHLNDKLCKPISDNKEKFIMTGTMDITNPVYNGEYMIWTLSTDNPYHYKYGIISSTNPDKKYQIKNISKHKYNKKNELNNTSSRFINVIIDIYRNNWTLFIYHGELNDKSLLTLSVNDKLVNISSKENISRGKYKLYISFSNEDDGNKINLIHSKIFNVTSSNLKPTRHLNGMKRKRILSLENSPTDSYLIDNTGNARKKIILNSGIIKPRKYINDGDKKMDKKTDKKTDKKMDKKMDQKIMKQMERKIVKKTDKKISKQIESINKIISKIEYKSKPGYERFNSDYHQIIEVGRGAFGSVSKCYSVRLKEFVSIKAIKYKKEAEKAKKSFEQEKNILIAVQSPYIMKYIDFFDGSDIDGIYYLIAEYLEHTLQVLIKTCWNRRELLSALCIIIYQGCSALCVIHENGFLYGDAKEENFMVHNRKLKMIDFGLSRTLGKPINPSCTLQYAPPEILKSILNEKKKKYIPTPKMDIYNMGIMALNIYYGEQVQPKQEIKLMVENQKQHINRVKSMIGIDFEFKSILTMMLQPNPEARISAKAIVANEYFKCISNFLPLYKKPNQYKAITNFKKITSNHNPYLQRIQ